MKPLTLSDVGEKWISLRGVTQSGVTGALYIITVEKIELLAKYIIYLTHFNTSFIIDF